MKETGYNDLTIQTWMSTDNLTRQDQAKDVTVCELLLNVQQIGWDTVPCVLTFESCWADAKYDSGLV